MHRQLLIKAFKKAEQEKGTNVTRPLARHLSDYIVEDSKMPYGERVLSDHYRKVDQNQNENIYLREHAAESLSHYLGYESFTEFVRLNKQDGGFKEKGINRFLKTYKIPFIAIVLIIVGFTIYHYSDRQRWMVWQGDHYVEANFNGKKIQSGTLKIYKQERIDNFKKIDPDCNYQFFNIDKSPRVWYGKNSKKEYEYFTSLGLHPETGKSLKELTKYMIDTHICN